MGANFLAYVLALKLLSSERSQLLRDASNKLLNTHKRSIEIHHVLADTLEVVNSLRRSIKNDTFLWMLLGIFYFGHRKLHLSFITLYMRVALQSQYLFVVGAKPFSANPNVMSNTNVSILPYRYSIIFARSVCEKTLFYHTSFQTACQIVMYLVKYYE